jgi:hypothetical protein
MDNHANVIIVQEGRYYWFSQADQDHQRFLASRYPKPQAIAVMKEWHAEAPIETDLPFEEVLQQVELRQKQRQRASWATPARWLVKLSEPRCKAIQNIKPAFPLEEILQQVELLQKQRQRASWATPACWLARLSEPRCKAIQNTDQATHDPDDDSVD